MVEQIKSIHEDLIKACRANNRKAQFRIYKMYYRAMYNTCIRIVKDSYIAEDIMQESFLSAFSNMSGYNGDVTFGAWMKRIVINRSIDYLKKRKLELTELREEHYIINEEENNTELNFTVDNIKSGINNLPQGFRIVLSLYLLEGYDHEEIGQILDISASTSRSQFSRARKRLIEILN